MGMTDEHGNPIPEGSVALPTPEATLALRDQADTIQAALEASGAVLGPLVDLEARVKALESVFIPPDNHAPARRVFEHRLQKARLDVLGSIAKMVHDARQETTKPKLEVASADAIPKAYRG